jgi:hypothetical protein
LKGPALLEAAKKELSGLVLAILQEQAANLGFDPVLEQIQRAPAVDDKSIVLTVYRVAQRYPEAIRLMLDDPNLPPGELGQLCAAPRSVEGRNKQKMSGNRRTSMTRTESDSDGQATDDDHVVRNGI